MISELIDLKEYIVSEVGENADITLIDPDPGQYPYIKIVPDRDFAVFFGNSKLSPMDFPVTLEIITSKTEVLRGLEILYKLITKINQFNAQKGNQLNLDGTTEITDDTYRINLGYTLKYIVQDET